MNKTYKILITVAMLIFVIIGFVCMVGFTIGNRFGWLHLLIFVIISAIISFLSILFINGMEYVKSRRLTEPFIVLVIAFTVVFNVMYSGINKISADSEAKIYDTTVEYVYNGKGELHASIGFYDKNGNMQEVWDYNFIWFDDETCPEEGATITVEERQGGFGYPVFDLIKVNGRIER